MSTTSPGADVGFSIDPHSHPYTHLEFKNDPAEFHFAVLADNSGGPRTGVVAAGLGVINLLHPEFVVNLGDLVEGYTEPGQDTPATAGAYRAWWAEWDEYVASLEMPFFYTPGNHDLNNPASVKVWQERFGGTRSYTHFRYKDTLFLIVSTEDPPKDTDKLFEHDPERAELINQAYKQVKQLVVERAPVEQILATIEPIETYCGEINISDEQVDYFQQVLADNTDVRWTFVLMHSPAWWTAAGFDQDPKNFVRIEEALADRPYTVFAAHTHTYRYDQRHGRDYITTAMTGALNLPRPGAVDHIVWVTMTHDGPKIANLMLNGVFDKQGPDTDLSTRFGMYRPR